MAQVHGQLREDSMPANLGRSVLSVVALVVIGTVAACSDRAARLPTAPTVQQVEATASVFNALWRPGDQGTVLLGAVTTDLRGSGTDVQGGGRAPSALLSSSDTATAFRLRSEINQNSRLIPGRASSKGPLYSVAPGNVAGAGPASASAANGHGQLSRITLRARTFRSRTADGKHIGLAVIADTGRDGRPPMATLVFVENRLAAMTEHQYAKAGGNWRHVRSRTTFFDNDGHVGLVSENRDNPGESTAMGIRGSADKSTRTLAMRALSGLLQLVGPDALNAATVTRRADDAGCWAEAAAAALAAAAVVGQGLVVTAAAAAVAAADAAYAAAIVTCPEDPIGCLVVVAAAQAAQAAAAAGLAAAQAQLAIAIAASAAADAVLWACLNKPATSTTTDGSSGGSGGGGDLYCDVTTWYDASGDIVEVDYENCYMM
jgi:trimeric autotransporter adhesin